MTCVANSNGKSWKKRTYGTVKLFLGCSWQSSLENKHDNSMSCSFILFSGRAYLLYWFIMCSFFILLCNGRNFIYSFWQFMTSEHQYISRKDEGDRMIVFERGDLVFVFNFHWTNSYSDYRIGCLKPGKYKVC